MATFTFKAKYKYKQKNSSSWTLTEMSGSVSQQNEKSVLEKIQSHHKNYDVELREVIWK